MNFGTNGRRGSGDIRRRSVLTLAGALVLSVPARGFAANLQTVTIVNPVSRVVDPSFLPVDIGMQQGIFAKHGIEVKVNVAKTSQIATASLVSGEADIGMIQPAFVVAADADSAGADFKLIGSVYDNLDYFIVTTPDITDLKQLEGKIEAGPGPNNGNTIVFRAAIERAGVDSSKITYATVGVQDAIVAALIAGQAQAGLLVAAPAAEAVKAGMVNHGSVEKYLPAQSSIAVTATADSLKKNGEKIRAFMAALTEATDWMLAHHDQSLAMFAKQLDMSPQDAKPIFDAGFNLVGKNLAMSKDGLKDWIGIATKYKLISTPVNVDDVYTDAYLPK